MDPKATTGKGDLAGFYPHNRLDSHQPEDIHTKKPKVKATMVGQVNCIYKDPQRMWLRNQGGQNIGSRWHKSIPKCKSGHQCKWIAEAFSFLNYNL